jgi:hypothetical protein
MRPSSTTAAASPSEGTSLLAALDRWHAKADGTCAIDYGFHMIISDVNETTLKEMRSCVDAGVNSFNPLDHGDRRTGLLAAEQPHRVPGNGDRRVPERDGKVCDPAEITAVGGREHGSRHGQAVIPTGNIGDPAQGRGNQIRTWLWQQGFVQSRVIMV